MVFGIAGVATRVNGKRWADLFDEGSPSRREEKTTGRTGSEAAAYNDSASAQSSGMTSKSHLPGNSRARRVAGGATPQVLKSRSSGNVSQSVRSVYCIESASPRSVQDGHGYVGRKFESCGPRSGLHANARAVSSVRNDIFRRQVVSFSKASSAAGGAQNVEQSSRADRDAWVHRRWRRSTQMRQHAACQSRRNPSHSGGSRLYSSAFCNWKN